MEQWKDCDWLDGYRGILQVSNKARVRRLSYSYESLGRWGEIHTTTKPDKILSSYVEKNGYATVAVQIDGKRKKFALHYLVGRAFVDGYKDGLCINHIDGNKTNNIPKNLEWVTRARNTAHAWETGLVDLRGEKHPTSKLTSGQVRVIRDLLRLGATPGQISLISNVSTSTIDHIKNGRRWSSV